MRSRKEKRPCDEASKSIPLSCRRGEKRVRRGKLAALMPRPVAAPLRDAALYSRRRRESALFRCETQGYASGDDVAALLDRGGAVLASDAHTGICGALLLAGAAPCLPQRNAILTSFLVDPGFEPGIRRGAFAYQLRLCHGGLFTGAVLGLDFRADKFAHRIRGLAFHYRRRGHLSVRGRRDGRQADGLKPGTAATFTAPCHAGIVNNGG